MEVKKKKKRENTAFLTKLRERTERTKDRENKGQTLLSNKLINF